MIPLMSISRNFFLGSEPTTGWGPFRRFDVEAADRISRDELHKMGIQVRDTGSRSAPSPAASGNRWRSRGRSTSAPRC